MTFDEQESLGQTTPQRLNVHATRIKLARPANKRKLMEDRDEGVTIILTTLSTRVLASSKKRARSEKSRPARLNAKWIVGTS